MTRYQWPSRQPAARGRRRCSRRCVHSGARHAEHTLLPCWLAHHALRAHIIVDDLRPELGAYGLPNRHTPNLDRLADVGTASTARAQQAVCGPSRLLPHGPPDRSRSWNFINHFREDHPEWTTLPGLFLAAGGEALGARKAFHPSCRRLDGDRSWSAAALPYRIRAGTRPTTRRPVPGRPAVRAVRDRRRGAPLPQRQCLHCQRILRDRRLRGRPHRRRRARAAARRPRARRLLSRGGPPQAAHAVASWPRRLRSPPARERRPARAPATAVGRAAARVPLHRRPRVVAAARCRRRRARGAAHRRDDRDGSEVGRLLDELDALGIENSTAVVAHSDHGWHLGEHNMWRRKSNFEAALRVPLVFAPWLPRRARSAAIVELVDVLPTIAALAGLTLPVNESFDGVSRVPLLLGDESDDDAAAFSQYRGASRTWRTRGRRTASSTTTAPSLRMGYSVRTAEWRLTMWVVWTGRGSRRSGATSPRPSLRPPRRGAVPDGF